MRKARSPNEAGRKPKRTTRSPFTASRLKALFLGFSALAAISTFFMSEANVTEPKQSTPPSVPQGPTITLTGVRMNNVRAGVSVPAESNAKVTMEDVELNHVDTGVEVRDRKALPEIMTKLPPGVTEEQVLAALKAVQSAPANEQAREAAVKQSPIWEAIKESGPDVVAFLIKTAVALL